MTEIRYPGIGRQGGQAIMIFRATSSLMCAAVALVIMAPGAGAQFLTDGPLLEPECQTIQELRADVQARQEHIADRRQHEVRIVAAAAVAACGAIFAILRWRKRSRTVLTPDT
jgi:hypothetical protein